MLKLTASSAAIIALFAATASAENFTFESTSKTVAQAMSANPAGTPIGGNAFTYSNTTTYASGATAASTGTCVSWATPGQNTNISGVCNAKETDADTFDVAFACNGDSKGASICWGALVGRTGKYEGKTGHASWSGTLNAEGGMSKGTGAWN